MGITQRAARHRRILAAAVTMFIVGVFRTTMMAQVLPMPAAAASAKSATAVAAERVAMPAAALLPSAGALPPGAALPPPVENTAAPTSVRLLVGRSALVDVGSPIARVSLTSADVADALVTSANQLLVHGKVPGAISMFVWTRAGGVSRYEIAVQRDLERLTEQVKQLFPTESIQVQSNGRLIVLSGSVTHKDMIDRAVNVASGYVEKREDVVTLLQIQDAPASAQVLLRVRFAEVSRSAMSEFGMSLFTSPTGVKNTVGRVTTDQFGAPGFSDLAWTKANGDFGGEVTSAEGKFSFSDFLNLFLLSERFDLGLMVRALQSRGLFQSLAEPNLVAESGKEASFLAGGEFPVPVAQGSGANMAISVMFKEFGIRLNFTPTVTGNRIHLKVRPEVSTLDYGNAVMLNGFRIPALSTRRTETSLELRDGQTFAIAGLMNNQMNQTLRKIPGIGDIPILGHLFKSKAAQKDQTELIVMITPEILRPNSPGVSAELPRIAEPFLAPVPANRTLPMPAPAFVPGAPGAVSAPASIPELTGEERKALERASRRERDRLEREQRAGAADAAKAAKQAQQDARVQKAEQERQDKLARAQAERDAETARRDADAAKRAAEAARRAATQATR